MKELFVYLICALLLGLPYQLIYIFIIQELRCSIFKNDRSIVWTVLCTLVFFILAPALYVMGVTSVTSVFLAKGIAYPYFYYVLSFFWAATYAAKFPRADDSYNAILRRGPTMATLISFAGYFLFILKPSLLPGLAVDCAHLVVGVVYSVIIG